jgi:hypothetical protein
MALQFWAESQPQFRTTARPGVPVRSRCASLGTRLERMLGGERATYCNPSVDDEALPGYV